MERDVERHLADLRNEEYRNLGKEEWGKFPEKDLPGNIDFENESARKRVEDLLYRLNDIRRDQRDFGMKFGK